MTPSCSIVIRTLNEGRYLEQLLQTIAAQDYPGGLVEVIIVDSGSTDDTLAIAQRKGCRILHIDREVFSFGRSLNLGAEAATGEILVFISGHCVPVDKQWLAELVAPYADNRVAVTYGRQIGGPDTKFSEHVLFAKYFPGGGSSGQAPFYCNNANATVRRSVWAEFRFDENLTGLEDMHLAKRCVDRGGAVAYAPAACVYHYHHERWRQVKRRYEREAIALQAIMPEVHVRIRDVVRYFCAGVLGDWRRAIKEKVLLRHGWEIVAFRFCQFYGAWRGNHVHRQLSHRQKERYFYPN
jgi:glycosyltransferase involved in cell wall biosynthesis